MVIFIEVSPLYGITFKNEGLSRSWRLASKVGEGAPPLLI